MKLHLQTPDGILLINGYESGSISVNGKRHEQSLIILPQRIIENWSHGEPSELCAEHFSNLREAGLEILLLGTGVKHRFPSPRLMVYLAGMGIGLESMDTLAACRTYNILAGEGRKVAAALMLFRE
ncbi:MAG: Mth938-like domain-containing protein [Sulfuricellaceae bacterium]|nr:Mth938-like domain-containing protein [Sulfuricellaceae bacterium]